MMRIKSEDLAYWFLRLNGFLTIQNFVVHPDTGTNQRTDVDILGVRFPNRRELISKPMKDYYLFTRSHKIFVAFCEVKAGKCDLNPSWIDPSRQNLQRILRAVGTHYKGRIDKIAQFLYGQGFFRDKYYQIRFLCIGGYKSLEIEEKYPKVNQILFKDILEFIFERFSKYPDKKAEHPQWDKNGKELWNTFQLAENSQQFIQSIQIE